MKRTLLAIAFALSLSFFGGAVDEAKAMEPAGHSFCKDGVGTQDQLAAKIERSLAADSGGNRKLEECYAAPIHFLLAFQQADPEAGLTSVSQLPAYVRKLVATEVDRTTEYKASCIQERTRGGDVVNMGCVTRTVREGEVIYSNPDTDTRVLWGACANPGFAETLDVVVVSDCVPVDFPSMGQGTAIRFGYIGARPLPGRCHALQIAGEAERRYDYPEECPDTYQKTIGNRLVTVVCSWEGAEANSSQILGQRVEVQNASGSFYADADGTNRWVLPPQALEGHPTVCWEFADGTSVSLSVHRGMLVNGVLTITEEMVRDAIAQQQ